MVQCGNSVSETEVDLFVLSSSRNEDQIFVEADLDPGPSLHRTCTGY